MTRTGLLYRHIVTSLVVVLMLSSFSFHAKGQDISQASLTWTVSHLFDQNNQENIDYACTFKTSGVQDITWLQKSGAFVTTLSVQSVEGGWTDVSTIGKSVYHVTKGSQTGTLTFERAASGLLITLTLSQATGSTLGYQFTASTVSLTN